MNEALIQALTVLQQATALDFNGDINAAIEMNVVAADRLDAVAAVLPTELALTARHLSDDLKRKADILRRSRSSKTQLSQYPPFPIQFVPLPTPVEDYRVPKNPVLRVFWLMRVLGRSMQSGAFLTPGLYVPKAMWYQEGGAASLSSLGAKVKYLTGICESIEPLYALKTLGDFSKTSEVLNTFLTEEAVLRCALDHYMGRRADAALSKKTIWGVFSRKAKQWRQGDGNLELCLTWACNALEQAQLFERWYLYFLQASQIPNNPSVAQIAPIIDILRRISVQFYAGPCIFLLQDMAKLMERFESKSRTSVTRLLPAGIKIELVA